MAEDKEEKLGELCHFSACKAENGWKLCFQFEDKNMSLSQRAGWVPCAGNICKDFVEKTDQAVVARVKKVLSGDCSK